MKGECVGPEGVGGVEEGLTVHPLGRVFGTGLGLDVVRVLCSHYVGYHVFYVSYVLVKTCTWRVCHYKILCVTYVVFLNALESGW